MAVFANSISVTASAANVTLTGWAPYVQVTVPAGSVDVYVTTDGSTPVTTGVDSTRCPAGTTTYVKNRTPRPALTVTTPGANDPSAVEKVNYNGTKVSAIGTGAGPTVTGVSLASSAGNLPVLG